MQSRSEAVGWVSIEVQGEVPSVAGITLPEEAGGGHLSRDDGRCINVAVRTSCRSDRSFFVAKCRQ